MAGRDAAVKHALARRKSSFASRRRRQTRQAVRLEQRQSPGEKRPEQLALSRLGAQVGRERHGREDGKTDRKDPAPHKSLPCGF